MHYEGGSWDHSRGASTRLHDKMRWCERLPAAPLALHTRRNRSSASGSSSKSSGPALHADAYPGGRGPTGAALLRLRAHRRPGASAAVGAHERRGAREEKPAAGAASDAGLLCACKGEKHDSCE
mmetsp:Transcript_21180/g.48710  ORF Transcript_21180/g.48710 Transcript_21180/m.48710 type:complete len:124 (+) Transcript_21180:166-537(+)